jgi:hypothetical protein
LYRFITTKKLVKSLRKLVFGYLSGFEIAILNYMSYQLEEKGFAKTDS